VGAFPCACAQPSLAQPGFNPGSCHPAGFLRVGWANSAVGGLLYTEEASSVLRRCRNVVLSTAVKGVPQVPVPASAGLFGNKNPTVLLKVLVLSSLYSLATHPCNRCQRCSAHPSAMCALQVPLQV
jgi:hypothetical protein